MTPPPPKGRKMVQLPIPKTGIMTPKGDLRASGNKILGFQDKEHDSTAVISRSSTGSLLEGNKNKNTLLEGSKELSWNKFVEQEVPIKTTRQILFQDLNERIAQRKYQTETNLKAAICIERMASDQHPGKFGLLRKKSTKSTFYFFSSPNINIEQSATIINKEELNAKEEVISLLK